MGACSSTHTLQAHASTDHHHHHHHHHNNMQRASPSAASPIDTHHVSVTPQSCPVGDSSAAPTLIIDVAATAALTTTTSAHSNMKTLSAVTPLPLPCSHPHLTQITSSSSSSSSSSTSTSTTLPLPLPLPPLPLTLPSSALATNQLVAPRFTAQHFQLVHLMGVGGFGVVYSVCPSAAFQQAVHTHQLQQVQLQRHLQRQQHRRNAHLRASHASSMTASSSTSTSSFHRQHTRAHSISEASSAQRTHNLQQHVNVKTNNNQTITLHFSSSFVHESMPNTPTDSVCKHHHNTNTNHHDVNNTNNMQMMILPPTPRQRVSASASSSSSSSSSPLSPPSPTLSPQQLSSPSSSSSPSSRASISSPSLSSYPLLCMKRMAKSNILHSQFRIDSAFNERDIGIENAESVRNGDLGAQFLVPLYHAFQNERELFFISPLACGGNLLQLMKKRDRCMTVNEARFYVAEIVLGVASLHRRNIVHRDLKHANVLLDGAGHVQICDFGLASYLLDEYNYRVRSDVGTDGYGAPEMRCDTHDTNNNNSNNEAGYGTSVDYYALGVMLYEMLHGHHLRPTDYQRRRAERRERLQQQQQQQQQQHHHHHQHARRTSESELSEDTELHAFAQQELLRDGRCYFASHISYDARSLIVGLLIADPAKRLGSRTIFAVDGKNGKFEKGWDEVKNHPFFHGIDWDKLANKLIPSPYVPSPPPAASPSPSSSSTTSSSSSPMCTDSAAHYSPEPVSDAAHAAFLNWDYNNNVTNYGTIETPAPTVCVSSSNKVFECEKEQQQQQQLQQYVESVKSQSCFSKSSYPCRKASSSFMDVDNTLFHFTQSVKSE